MTAKNDKKRGAKNCPRRRSGKFSDSDINHSTTGPPPRESLAMIKLEKQVSALRLFASSLESLYWQWKGAYDKILQLIKIQETIVRKERNFSHSVPEEEMVKLALEVLTMMCDKQDSDTDTDTDTMASMMIAMIDKGVDDLSEKGNKSVSHD